MTTALELITDALVTASVLGINEAVQSEDAEFALRTLNGMVDGMATGPTWAYSTSEVVYSLPANTQTRTIGPSQQINVDRPMRLETGCYTRISGIDRPLAVVDFQDYAGAALKSTQSTWPSCVYYDARWPTGMLYFWPVGSACELHLFIHQRISEFADVSTAYNLPPAHRRALVLMLAEDLALRYGRELTPSLRLASANAQRALRRANLVVPTLKTEHSGSDWWVPPQ